MMKNLLAIFVLVWAGYHSGLAQDAPFSRGVNLTNWFQVGSAEQIQISRYQKKDFEQIKGLGCDVIRLPINLHFMTDGAPNYNLEPLFLQFLDSAVKWAEEVDIHLILDNHTFDPAVSTDPAVGDILVKVWTQMATHYKDASDKIYYEVLNEPHGIANGLWGSIQGRVIDSIRTVDTDHTIIVGGSDWNSYTTLQGLPLYSDTNLIYTFHFYDPFIFTHQGASWTGPSMEDLGNVPFPYDATKMPGLPPSLNGSWVGNLYNNYSSDGTIAKMRQLLDIAVQFKNSRKVPIYCGEFGVYIPNSDPQERVNWYDEFHTMLDTSGIAWTMWDYHGGFGVFEPNSDGLFDHDLNTDLLQALGFNVPPQTPFSIQADTAGFFVYRDFVEAGIRDASGPGGPLSFYAQNSPTYGDYHIDWSNGGQYNALGFNYFPDKDLSVLESNSYALDFFVKASAATTGNMDFDVRFVDSKTADPSDLPWRNRYTFKPGNNGWNHFHIPLSSFFEHGSWYNNTWNEPQGKFTWQEVDVLEFVSEYGAFSGTLSFDHIQLTDMDTAMVTTTSVIGDERPLALVYPNPVKDVVNIRLLAGGNYSATLMDVMGREVWHGELPKMANRIYLAELESGLYLLRLKDRNGKVEEMKLLKR